MTRWLLLWMAAVGVAAVAALALTIWTLSDAAVSNRQVAAELEAHVARLDAQAEMLAELDTIVARLDMQADAFEANAAEARAARVRFEDAVGLLLDAADVDAEPFADHDHDTSTPEPEPDPDPEPSPEPSGRRGPPDVPPGRDR